MARFPLSRPSAMLLLALPVLALTGCGERTDLRPSAHHTLPTPPYGRVDKPSSAELLVHTPEARPVLSIELHQRSEERVDDPFDLPPKE